MLPVCSFILLHGFAAIGLPVVDTALWGGVLVTIVVATVGIVFSLPLGILLALGRRSDMPTIKLFSVIFIEFVRGVPLITVLFMASVMLPLFVPEQYSPDKLLRALIGIALFSSAYMAEVVRAGLQAIPKGQFEGAMGVGLGYWQMMGLIVLPQALKITIPNIVNTYIGLFKDTTLVFIVGLFDFLHTIEIARIDPKWAAPVTSHDRLCGRRDLLSVLLLLDVALRPRDGSASRQGRQTLAHDRASKKRCCHECHDKCRPQYQADPSSPTPWRSRSSA